MYIIANKKICRTCGHVQQRHWASPSLLPEYQNCCHAWRDGPNEDTNTLCTCKEYIPKDNLEFVEWTYEKQHEKQHGRR
jgi:hypothetical protein